MFRSLVGDKKKTAPEEEIDKTDAKENSSKVPNDTLGLHVLYEPEHGNVAVDIIAVHGLGGGSFSTWTHRNGTNWLRDLLYKHLPNARIMTYGYNTDLMSKARTERSFTIVEDLLTELRDLRSGEARPRPLFFIAHSLGGIVVKKVLIISKSRSSKHGDILESTRHLMFFGTPHQGTTSVAGTVRRLAAAFSAEASVLRELELWSPQILETNSAFLTEIAPMFSITTYWEREKTSGVQIVDEGSARLNQADEDVIGLNADHRGLCRFSDVNDNKFVKVARRLGSEVGNLNNMPARMENLKLGPDVALNLTQSFRVSFYLPPYVVPYFVPRADELTHISTFLAPGEASERRKVYILHGLGGAGKTQLMLEFARLYKTSYTSIFWLDGATENSLRQSLLDIASRITSGPIVEALRKYKTARNKTLQSQEAGSGQSASTATSTHNLLLPAVISAIYDWLELEGNKKWLLLFDNVDREFPSPTGDSDAYNLAKYIPSADHGAVLVTTRHLQLCSIGDRSKTLTKMSEEQGLQVLAERSGYTLSELPPEAKELVKRVGGLPLALAQAGAYLKFNPGVADYLELYSKKWKDLMGGNANHDISLKDYANGSVGTTWSVSYEYIKQKYLLAAMMLKILTYFDGSDISHEIFKVDSEQTLVTWRQPPPDLVIELYDLELFKQLMTVLVDFAFLQRSPGRETYEMHPVVQDWCLFSSSRDEQDELSVLALCILGASIGRANDIDFMKAESIRKRLKIHSARCLSLLDPQIEDRHCSHKDVICHALGLFGQLDCYLGDYDRAVVLHRRSYRGFMDILGLDKIFCIRAGLKLASALAFAKRCADSENVLEAILEVLREKDCKEPFVRIITLVNLAKTCAKFGKFEKAERLYRQVLAFYSQNKPNDYNSINIAKVGLGSLLMEEKRVDEAAEVFAEALVTAKELWLGFPKITHGDLVCTKLAAAYKKLGKFEEAKMTGCSLSSDTWEGLTWILDNFETKYNLGLIREDEGRLEEAETFYKEAFNGRKEHIQDEADTTLLKYTLALGNTTRSRGRYAEANTLLVKVTALREQVLGVDDLDTLHSKHLLSLSLRADKQYAQAEKMSKEAFQGRKKLLGRNALLTMASSRVLANVLHSQGRNQDAEIIYKEDSMILEQQVGPDSIKLLEPSIERSQNLILMQDYKTADEILHHCLRLSEMSHGKTDKITLAVMFELIKCLHAQNNHRVMEKLCKQYCTGMYEILKVGPESLEASDGLFFLGLSYMSQIPPKLELAVSTFQGCVYQRTQGLEPDHSATLIATLHLADAYEKMGKLSQAAELLPETMKRLLTSKPRPRKLFLIEAFKWQGEIIWSLGKYELARKACRCHLAAWFQRETSDPPIALFIRADLPQAFNTSILERDYICKPEPPVATGSELRIPDHIRGCDGCKSSPMYGPFYHCLICWDTDLCANCFHQFQQYRPVMMPGGYPADGEELPQLVIDGCSPDHDFVAVERNSWVPDALTQLPVNAEGRTFSEWMADIKENFLSEMREQEPVWMERLAADD